MRTVGSSLVSHPKHCPARVWFWLTQDHKHRCQDPLPVVKGLNWTHWWRSCSLLEYATTLGVSQQKPNLCFELEIGRDESSYHQCSNETAETCYREKRLGTCCRCEPGDHELSRPCTRYGSRGLYPSPSPHPLRLSDKQFPYSTPSNWIRSKRKQFIIWRWESRFLLQLTPVQERLSSQNMLLP